MPKTNFKKTDNLENMLKILNQIKLSYNLSSGVDKRRLEKIKSKLQSLLNSK
ncbi:MAG: hypothetical protein AAGF07_03540 [Patescibacteria group bacterium]